MEVNLEAMFAQVNVQPPKHEQKANTSPSCRGDCSLSRILMYRVPLFLLHPCISVSFSQSLSRSLSPLHLVNWALPTIQCFSHYSHHSGQIALSFRTIGLCSLAAPATRGLHKSFPPSLGCFRANMGLGDGFYFTGNNAALDHRWHPALCSKQRSIRKKTFMGRSTCCEEMSKCFFICFSDGWEQILRTTDQLGDTQILPSVLFPKMKVKN